MTSLTTIERAALEAVAHHPKSQIEMAMEFTKKSCPSFWKEAAADSSDRFVKVGRSLESLVALKDKIDFKQALELLVEECSVLASGDIKVPKVRFGKTELQMPIVTLGCMRFQQEWGPRIDCMNMVGSDCQDNLMRILKRSIDFGINHIETARGYGCSELQLGVALKQLMDTGAGAVKREDLIIQTKVPAHETAASFRDALEKSFANLQLEYLDLFSFHGCNMEHHYSWIFDNGENGNCWDVIEEYRAKGKIKHVGFSTHGPEDLIARFIETDRFEYVNLHYHFVGSYTTTGVGKYAGNLGNIKLLKEKDMGVFIISNNDKGGKLYAPSNKFRSLCLPDLEPMAFGSAWLWNHKHLGEGAPCHTISVGAARAADVDQPAAAAYLQGLDPEGMLTKVKAVVDRLEKAAVEALGTQWLDTCYKGIPKSNVSKHHVEHNQIIWCYNMIKAFGLWEFAKDRYGSLENNRAKWDKSLSLDENIENVGRSAWGYVPGLSIEPSVDYADDLVAVPEENKARVLEAETFVHKWCAKKPSSESKKGKEESEEKKNDPEEDQQLIPPTEWKSIEMKPWMDFPDRPSALN